jgi:hypothetical protein
MAVNAYALHLISTRRFIARMQRVAILSAT